MFLSKVIKINGIEHKKCVCCKTFKTVNEYDSLSTYICNDCNKTSNKMKKNNIIITKKKKKKKNL